MVCQILTFNVNVDSVIVQIIKVEFSACKSILDFNYVQAAILLVYSVIWVSDESLNDKINKIKLYYEQKHDSPKDRKTQYLRKNA